MIFSGVESASAFQVSMPAALRASSHFGPMPSTTFRLSKPRPLGDLGASSVAVSVADAAAAPAAGLLL